MKPVESLNFIESKTQEDGTEEDEVEEKKNYGKNVQKEDKDITIYIIK